MAGDLIVVSEQVVEVIEVEPNQVELQDSSITEIVEIGIIGPQGPPGTPGQAGAGFNYHHVQAVPASSWVITHNLNGYPNITVVDSAGSQVEGEVTYNSVNQITVVFGSAFAGDAYLS